MKDDPFNLERFIEAQNDSFDTALAEIASGKKRTHWIWYIFPQLRGLGHSSTAQFYGLGSLTEAKAYLNHELLSARLTQCTKAVINGKTEIHSLFGSPDDMKFRSSMTLFNFASKDENDVFQQAIKECCDGKADEKTIQILNGL